MRYRARPRDSGGGSTRCAASGTPAHHERSGQGGLRIGVEVLVAAVAGVCVDGVSVAADQDFFLCARPAFDLHFGSKGFVAGGEGLACNKNGNWRIAREMNRSEVDYTDLEQFLKTLASAAMP